MNKFTYKVELVVEVEAFDSDDALTVISDYLGDGPMGDVLLVRRSDVQQV